METDYVFILKITILLNIVSYWINNILSIRKPHLSNKSKQVSNYLTCCLFQFILIVLYSYNKYNNYLIELMIGYFIWDIIYFTYIEDALFSKGMLFHHASSLLFLNLIRSAFETDAIIYMNNIIYYMEFPNLLSNLSMFLCHYKIINFKSFEFCILNITYLLFFAYHRFYCFTCELYALLIYNSYFQLSLIYIGLLIFIPLNIRLFYNKFVFFINKCFC